MKRPPELPIIPAEQVHWICSDHHFFHARIREYEPWRQDWCSDGDHMNEQMIEAWNRAVDPAETVLHLGDLALCPAAQLPNITARLNGNIILVRGNHDGTKAAGERAGMRVERGVVVKFHSGHEAVCRHNPAHFTPEDVQRSLVLLHGHQHGRPSYTTCTPGVAEKAFDIGVDAVRTTAPVRFAKLFESLLNG